MERQRLELIKQYPPVRDAQPNPTHIYIAALQLLNLAPNLITQNAGHLHPRTWSYPPSTD